MFSSFSQVISGDLLKIKGSVWKRDYLTLLRATVERKQWKISQLHTGWMVQLRNF
jgi:hypothetical protein